jgi:acetyl-CoA C-acetyltransferase
MTNDVAIIGVGLHPFGRFEGKSAMEMGVDAIFAAVADAGVEWKDIQFATGGSWTVANPDAIVGMVGLSGIPFTNVFNACATAASAPDEGAAAVVMCRADIAHRYSSKPVYLRAVEVRTPPLRRVRSQHHLRLR